MQFLLVAFAVHIMTAGVTLFFSACLLAKQGSYGYALLCWVGAWLCGYLTHLTMEKAVENSYP